MFIVDCLVIITKCLIGHEGHKGSQVKQNVVIEPYLLDLGESILTLYHIGLIKLLVVIVHYMYFWGLPSAIKGIMLCKNVVIIILSLPEVQ